MGSRLILRYSDAFKRQVVEDLESGRFSSAREAGAHHGIKGATTVRNWARRLGKNHLLAKVVRVEKIGEADRMSALRAEVARLERALGQTQAKRLLSESYLELACVRLGEEVEAFKKKCDGKRCIAPSPASKGSSGKG
jgi:transposase-like protein